ncbi:aromatic acid exporter family protein [Paenibacillus sp. P25]|nr:aromatic acid exporter family protein [Paenibacillus sp. P25]
MNHSMRKFTDFLKYKGVVWKIPLAAALSWELAKLAGSKHPYLAPLTVVLSVQLTVDQSVRFAWRRIVGTIAGVLFTIVLMPYVGLSGWGIGLLLLAGMLIVTWLKLEHALTIQVALSILLVLELQSKFPSYSLDRIRDTLIGAVATLVIHILVFPPDSVDIARKKMIRFADHLSRHFAGIALWVQGGCPPSEAGPLHNALQPLFRELHQTTTELDQAEQSLRYRPFGRSKQGALNELNRQMQGLRSGYAGLAEMTGVLTKWSESGGLAAEDRQLWAGHLNALAGLVKEWKEKLENPAALLPAGKDPAWNIQAPAPMKSYQYPVALYMNAEQIVQAFRNALQR